MSGHCGWFLCLVVMVQRLLRITFIDRKKRNSIRLFIVSISSKMYCVPNSKCPAISALQKEFCSVHRRDRSVSFLATYIASTSLLHLFEALDFFRLTADPWSPSCVIPEPASQKHPASTPLTLFLINLPHSCALPSLNPRQPQPIPR